MGLLDKLEQVEIKADSRLPEDDLMFCETQQQAYDESCRALREIRQQWKKAIQAQRDLLGIGTYWKKNMALTAMRHGIVMNTSRIISSYRLKSCPSCCRQIL